MEISVSTGEMDNLKIENEKLIEEISMLKKEIYDLKNSHIQLMIKEEEEEEEEEEECETRNTISPYEQMMVCKEHMLSIWNKRKSEAEWPFKINGDMSDLEITRRKEALKLWQERIEEGEIYDIFIDDTIYLSDGLLVIEVIDEEELGDVVGYIDPNMCENDAEQVIFFN